MGYAKTKKWLTREIMAVDYVRVSRNERKVD